LFIKALKHRTLNTHYLSTLSSRYCEWFLEINCN